MCSIVCKGYPNDYKKNMKINNLENIKIKNNQSIFHAGTKFENENFFSIGGRVLNIVALGETFDECKKETDQILNKIDWKEGFFRKDIGYKVTNK